MCSFSHLILFGLKSTLVSGFQSVLSFDFHLPYNPVHSFILAFGDCCILQVELSIELSFAFWAILKIFFFQPGDLSPFTFNVIYIWSQFCHILCLCYVCVCVTCFFRYCVLCFCFSFSYLGKGLLVLFLQCP